MAKKVISDFVWKLKTDRIWLIVFSWKPFTSVPLTFDYNFVKDYVDKISMDTINQNYGYLQWTDMWAWILLASTLFNEKDNREKVIVLLTDWKPDKDDVRYYEQVKNINISVRYSKFRNIKVHTIWIWEYWKTYIYLPNKKDVSFDDESEKNLQKIGSLTWGEYYRASDNDTFSKLFEKLNLLQKKEIEVEEILVFLPDYKPFVYGIILVFIMFLGYNFYFYLRN
jgi:Ca-activated chloride channel family protein